jgi:CRISPR-associated protein Cmr1
VAAALWAWETFGGVGARTRRGFGALACTQIVVDGEKQSVILPDAETANEWILGTAERENFISTGEFPDNVPHLKLDQSMLRVTRSYSRSGQKSAGLQAWIALFNRLQQFRQNRQGTFGPSNWPEANAIRALFGRNPHPEEPTIGKFPRADFGLPIGFKFMDQENLPKTSLQGVEHDRLASPLILRPLRCAEDQAVGLTLILDTPRRPPGGLKLQDAPGNPKVAADLDPGPPNEAVFPPLNGKTDVLKAFLNTIN